MLVLDGQTSPAEAVVVRYRHIVVTRQKREMKDALRVRWALRVFVALAAMPVVLSAGFPLGRETGGAVVTRTSDTRGQPPSDRSSYAVPRLSAHPR